MTATLSPTDLPTVTLPVTATPPHNARIRAALRAFGRSIVQGMATENGWFWAYGIWYPYYDMGSRYDDRRG